MRLQFEGNLKSWSVHGGWEESVENITELLTTKVINYLSASLYYGLTVDPSQWIIYMEDYEK